MVPATDDRQEMPSWVPVAEGLLVATQKGPGTTVLIPFPGLEEWQLWTHWKEDGTAYVSFRSYLEHEVAGLEAWYPSVDEVRALIDGPEETFSRRMHRLRCVASEDALPSLLECIAAGRREAWAAVSALGRIGTPAALEALVEVGSSRSQPAMSHVALTVLAKVDPATAADVYAQRGDFDGLRRLGDARAVPLAAAALRDGTASAGIAAQILGRSGDVQHIPTLLDAYPRAELAEPAVIASALHDLGAPEGERYLRELAAAPNYGWAYMAQHRLDRIEKRRQSSRQ
jgi:HEAT repeat protein